MSPTVTFKSTSDLKTLFRDLEHKKQATANKKYDSKEHKDKTRSTIALWFVKGYLALIAGVFTLCLVYNLILILTGKPESLLLNPKDIILLISGSIGTSVGFVIGYYFKGRDDDSK